MSSRRRMLLVEPSPADSLWLTEQLGDRFRYFEITRVQTAAEAHQELINRSYDVIVTDLFGDADRPVTIVYELIELTPTTPIVVLTTTTMINEHMLDVIAAGIKHVLYKEDVKKDISKLVAAVVDIIHELSRRDAVRDAFSSRMHAVSRKVNDVEVRMRSIERMLEGVVQSINAMVQVIEKRGGLEDRVKELEDTKAKAIKIGAWAAGGLGALLSAVAAGVVALLKR